MSDSFDAYQKWLGIPPHQQPPHHYRLLGIELFEADRDTIANAADRQMAHVRTFQAGEHADLSQQLLNQIAGAKVELLNPERKAKYDAALQTDLTAQQTALIQSQEPAEPLPGQQLSAAHQMVPPIQAAPQPEPPVHSLHEEPVDEAQPAAAESPVWRHPAVVVGGAVCLLLLVGIAVAATLRREPAQQAAKKLPAAKIPPIETSAGADFPDHLRYEKIEPGSSRDNEAGRSSTEEAKTADSETPAAKAESEKPPGGADPSTEPATEPAAVTSIPEGTPPEPEKSEPTVVANADPVEPPPMELSGEEPEGKHPDPAEEAPRVKHPVPDREQEQAAIREIRSIFSKEYEAAETPLKKESLARSLVKQADRLAQDAVARYALLTEARNLAEEAGAYRLALAVIDRTFQDYRIDALAKKQDLLARIARTARSVPARREIGTMALELVNEANRGQRFEVAEALAVQANALAARIKDNRLRNQAREAGNAIRRAREEWKKVEQAIAALAQDESDAAANTIYGRFLCLEKHDWEAGLVHLARGENGRLREAARRDLSAPEDPDEQVALADLWYEIAGHEPHAQDFRIREYYWYAQALPETTGLTRTKVEKRMRENPQVERRRESLFLPADGFLEE